MKKFYYAAIVLLCLSLVPVNQIMATKHLIAVMDYAFSPANLTGVYVGDTIRWEWVNGHHTTTSGSIPEGALPWDALITHDHMTFEYVPQLPGVYNYVCTPHVPVMVASFTVLPAQTLSVEPDNQNVEAEAGTTTFSVLSNTAWTVESDSEWCSTISAGDGDGIIEVNYAANPSSDIRIATLTVSVSNMEPQTVTVTQAASGLSVAEVELPGFRIYPNPTLGLVTITFERFKYKEVNLTLISSDGLLVMEKTFLAGLSETFDFSHFPAGIYVLVVQTENKKYSRPIVLNTR